MGTHVFLSLIKKKKVTHPRAKLKTCHILSNILQIWKIPQMHLFIWISKHTIYYIKISIRCFYKKFDCLIQSLYSLLLICRWQRLNRVTSLIYRSQPIWSRWDFGRFFRHFCNLSTKNNFISNISSYFSQIKFWICFRTLQGENETGRIQSCIKYTNTYKKTNKKSKY